MLFPVFVGDGKNLHRASARTAHSRSASYVRSTLYDVRREHPCSAENPGPSRHKNDHALCSPGTRSP
ncbi:hypothetical protein SIL20_17330 [Scandinavium sp. V105_12]|uniref:Uncharacterized protein n=1 Tax=Scandinavium lactucae TaxID=3095028 RepID=A0AAJ2S7D8_9ENTR|nr:hypothetical protein [Scandinavium sp. V105_12]MDX6033264.1 hypothetical protein [Scandinavium sp. V105_12]